MHAIQADYLRFLSYGLVLPNVTSFSYKIITSQYSVIITKRCTWLVFQVKLICLSTFYIKLISEEVLDHNIIISHYLIYIWKTHL